MARTATLLPPDIQSLPTAPDYVQPKTVGDILEIPPLTVFGLGSMDPKDGLIWFLENGASIGSLRRTRTAERAKYFESRDALTRWLIDLSSDSRKQLEGRVLFVLPITMVVGPGSPEAIELKVIS